MSIVFSAITPHPPILIPNIGKENLKQLEKTQKAFLELKNNLYASKAETLIIISPHGPIQKSFTMNLNPKYEINFEEFGDFSTKFSKKSDIGLEYKIKESLETKIELQLISQEKLDHGIGIPLFMLTQDIDIKIIPVYYSLSDLQSHYNFGKLLKRELLLSDKKIAIIASSDLSHCLSKDAPAGYSPRANKFDRKIIEYLKQKNNNDLLNLDDDLLNDVKECGLRSIIILLGILNKINYEAVELSYEHPFGVGYLTMYFKM